METEQEGNGQFDTSPITRLVREVTFKILPLCGFLLVVFSAGAILVSTFSFDEPLPHQAAIAVSVLLLLFFVLFSVGLVYLHYQKIQSHATQELDSTGYPLYDVGNNDGRHKGRSNNSIQPGIKRGLVRTDTLEGRAPSPRTFKRKIRESDNTGQRQSMLHEIEGSLPPTPLQGDVFEAPQFSSDTVRKDRTQADAAFTPHYDRVYANTNSLSPQRSPIVPQPGGGLARPSPAVLAPMRPPADPRSRIQMPIPVRIIPEVGTSLKAFQVFSTYRVAIN